MSSVGKGRYGEVWLARWRGERVAVKVKKRVQKGCLENSFRLPLRKSLKITFDDDVDDVEC